MTEQPTSLAGLKPSASESLVGWATSQRLHPLTWLMILAALLHLAGDLVISIVHLANVFDRMGVRPQPLAIVLADIAHMFGYSLAFFGTAAMVEFLHRIWDELRRRRLGE